MKFRIDRAELSRAIQTLQSKAGSLDLVSELTHLQFKTVSKNQLELTAKEILADTKISISAEVVEKGIAFIPIQRLNQILRDGNSAEVEFTKIGGDQAKIEIGNQQFQIAIEDHQISTEVSLVDRIRGRRSIAKMSPAIAISLFIHTLFAIYLALIIKTIEPENESISVQFITEPIPTIRRIKKPLVDRVQPRVSLNPSLRESPQPQVMITAPTNLAETLSKSEMRIEKNLDLQPNILDEVPKQITTSVKSLVPSRDITLAPTAGNPSATLSGSGRLSNRVRAQSVGVEKAKGIASLVQATDAEDSADVSGSKFVDLIKVPDNRLGAILVGEGTDVQGHIRLIRLKHSLSDWWQDPTAIPSFITWLEDHTRLKADISFQGGALPITDDRIMEAPIIFMTGHDKDITTGRNLVRGGPLTNGFTETERAAIREYIVERGGMLFFDDCGFNGLFANQIAAELDRILPEYPLKNIEHNHEIYNIYYKLPKPPNGGDVFWGGNYTNPKATKFRHHKGIFIGRRLAVVYNRKDYFCSMETAEVDSRAMLRNRRSTDVHRFMTNLLFYAMKHGGNTDRSQYKSLSF